MDTAEYQRMDVAEESLWWYRVLHARLLDALRPTTGRVLDVGCGTGGFLSALRRVRPDLAPTGLEWHAQAVRRARAKSGAPVVRGTAAALPFAGASFDAAVAADVLCHAAVRPNAALVECARVLRPGGLLVVNMPAYSWLLSNHDRRVHNARRVTARVLGGWLEAAGFAQVRPQYWNGLLLPLMIARRKAPFLAGRVTGSDTAPVPPALDAALHTVASLEHRLGLRLPAGGSVLATAVRP